MRSTTWTAVVGSLTDGDSADRDVDELAEPEPGILEQRALVGEQQARVKRRGDLRDAQCVEDAASVTRARMDDRDRRAERDVGCRSAW